jgi:hypothetical protein
MEHNLNAWRTNFCVKNYFFITLNEVHKIHIIPHCGNADQYHILQKLIRGKLISNKETTLRSISQESLSSLLSIENKIPNILNSDYVLRDYLLSKET